MKILGKLFEVEKKKKNLAERLLQGARSSSETCLYPLCKHPGAVHALAILLTRSAAVLGSRPVLILTCPCLGLGLGLGLDLGLELCTKSMGLSFLSLVLISAPLVWNPILLRGEGGPVHIFSTVSKIVPL